MGASTIAAKAVLFLSSIVLARLLTPVDFGLNAMALVISNFLMTISVLGTGTALIQRQDDPEGHARSAFWLGMGLGVVLMLIQVLLAPLAARFYGEPVVAAILWLTAPLHLALAAANTPLALLNKGLQFRKVAVINLLAPLLGVTASIVMAAMGCAVWSLVWGLIVTQVANGALALVLCGWRPRWGLAREPVMNLLRYTGALLPGEICVFLNYTADNLIVGWMLGAKELGFYSFAYALGMALVAVFAAVTQSVFFPIFSRLQADRAELASCFRIVLQAIAFAAGPVSVWLMVDADCIVPLVFGRKWEPAIVPVQLLVAFGLLRSLGMQPAAALAKAIGRPDLSSKNAIILTPLALAGFVIGARFGITGVSVSVLLVLGVGSVVFAAIVCRAAGWSLASVLPALAVPAAASAAVWLVLAARAMVWPTDSLLLEVVADAALMAIVYAAITALVGPRLMGVIRGRRGGI
jgi:O-antigen/teichoic acid export membrane protein